MATSQEDSHFDQTYGNRVGKLCLNDDVSERVVRWRETHWYGCWSRNGAIVLNVTVMFMDWSCDSRVVISQTSHEVTRTRLGYKKTVKWCYVSLTLNRADIEIILVQTFLCFSYKFLIKTCILMFFLFLKCLLFIFIFSVKLIHSNYMAIVVYHNEPNKSDWLLHSNSQTGNNTIKVEHVLFRVLKYFYWLHCCFSLFFI